MSALYELRDRKCISTRLRLFGALLAAQNDEWLVAGHRYMSEMSLRKLSMQSEEELPDHWFTFSESGKQMKREFRRHRPARLQVAPDGRVEEGGSGVTGWFQPEPFLICQRCSVGVSPS